MTAIGTLLTRGDVPDIRSLSPQVRAELRREVVQAVGDGMSQVDAARHYGVSRRTVGIWTRAYRPDSPESTQDRPPARILPTPDILTPGQEIAVLDVMRTADPSYFRLQGHLWTRRSVTDLIRIETGHCLPAMTVVHYLHRWHLASEVPPDRGLDPVGGYPVRVSWHSISPPDLQVQDHPPGPRQRWPALVAESGHGAIYFRLRAEPIGPEALRAFGCHLAQQTRRSVSLLVWRWPPDRIGMLEQWRAESGRSISIEHLVLSTGTGPRPVAQSDFPPGS